MLLRSRLTSFLLLAVLGLAGVPACKPADAATVSRSSPQAFTPLTDYIATAAGDVTTMTITGLNGDRDGDYDIEANIIYKGSGSIGYFLQPFLTDETNLRCLFTYNAGSANQWQSQGSGTPTTGWFFQSENASGDHTIIMRGHLSSKTGRMRQAWINSSSTRISSGVVSASMVGWSLDTTTNITELTIYSTVASRQLFQGARFG